MKTDKDFKPYLPTQKDLKRITDFQKSFFSDANLKLKMKKRISALKRGEYYDAIKVAHVIGCENLRAGVIFRTLVALRVIKKTEFLFFKQIVHKTELPIFVNALKSYIELKQNWAQEIKIAKNALQES